ncbi:MAG: ATP-binding cassette domain-containing protein, partial [Chitinivibrionales bacterium]
MISLSGISKNYGEQHLFSDVTLSLQKGETCGLTGRNGHGKTTLLRIIAGTENPDSGSVSIPKGYRIGYLRQGISFSKPNILDEVTDNLPDVKQGETWIAEKTLAGLGFSEQD